MTPRILAGLSVVLLCATGCASLGDGLPDEVPPLASMVEPPALFDEPADEAERAALPLGGYTGIHVTDGRKSLGSLGAAPAGVLVSKVVENSPGDAAGIEEGDLVVAVRDASGTEREIHWPSEWRDVELSAEPGHEISVRVDRAGVTDETRLLVGARVRPAERSPAERYREEERTGIVVRTATEVEARRAGLAPGAGAVIVGLAAESPFRAAGLRFGDLVAKVNGVVVAHPQVLLDALRDADDDARLRLVVRRGTERFRLVVPVRRRAQEVRRLALPPLLTYGAERGESELSILLGLIRRRATAAGWEWRLLWLFSFAGGDADRLEDAR